MPDPTGAAGSSFDIAKVRVVIEGVDQASEPIRKVKEQAEDLSKKQRDVFPEKVMDIMESGWTKVGLAIAGVAAGFYGLVRMSPIFSSYVTMFFQALGALLDNFIAPLMPAFDWVIDKMWNFIDVAQSSVSTIQALYHEAKQFLGLEPKNSGQGTEGLESGQAGQGVGGLLGGVLGGLGARGALIGLERAGMKLPGWQGKLLGLGMIAAGGLAGGEVGKEVETGLITKDILGMTSPRPVGGEVPANNVNLNFYLTGSNEAIITQVEQKLREVLRGIGSGQGVP